MVRSLPTTCRLRSLEAGRREAVRGQRFAGAVAVVTFALAIVGLEPWTDRVLSAHMAQHLLLMVVVAPLAVVAWPLRRAPVWARSGAFAALAVAAQTVALVVWHLPGPFDAAEAHVPLHVLEHASFLVTAAAAWWVILTRNEASVGVRFATCVASAAPMMLLGALMTLAPKSLVHVVRERARLAQPARRPANRGRADVGSGRHRVRDRGGVARDFGHP